MITECKKLNFLFMCHFPAGLVDLVSAIIIILTPTVTLEINERLRMSSGRKIAYFYDPDVGNFHYGKECI